MHRSAPLLRLTRQAPQANRSAMPSPPARSAPRMSFTLDVTTSMPGIDGPIVARRTGSFDDETFAGVGTRSFITDDESLAALWGEEAFEFVVTDQTLWAKNPLAVPPEWAGFDLAEIGKIAGGNPLGSVDVDAYLSLILDASTQVIHVTEDLGAGRIWTIGVRSDDLVHLVAAAGPASRLTEVGAAESNLTTELQIQVSHEGRITGIRGQLNDWWTNALKRLGNVPPGLVLDETLLMDLQLVPFEQALQPEPPCQNPSSDVEDGLDVLICVDS